MKIKVDWSMLQEADDSSTTYYGGVVKLSSMDPATDKPTEQTFQCSGNDRSGGQHQILCDALAEFMGKPLTEEQEEALYEKDVSYIDGIWDSEEPCEALDD